MEKPRLPADEASRLTTLIALNILDTEPEERFDRYTRLAKKLFNAPIALVSLVDHNRQWFKSRQGFVTAETPRDVAFSAHAILHDQPLIIKDTKTDSRFADNPLVTKAPNIRFYAGRPLKAPDGSRIGALCVMDQKPKEFGNDDVTALNDLAQLVENEFKTTINATTDELTGLTNRIGFVSIAKHVLTMCERTGIPATLLYFDIDNLKAAPRQSAQNPGDQAIVELSKILLDSFRISDIIARLAGNEFCVLLTGADKVTTMVPLNRLYAKLEELNAGVFELDVSYGMVKFDRKQHHTIIDLLTEADTLMYLHKKMRRAQS